MMAIGYFIVLGMVWRDYHNSPFFDMCNLKYHSIATCHVARVFLVERDYTMVRLEVVWMWPEMCFWVATYLFWFIHGRQLFALARRVGDHVHAAWRKPWLLVFSVGMAALYLASVLMYENHLLDYPHFSAYDEPTMRAFEMDQYTFGRLADLCMYTFQALVVIFVCSQVRA
jgi:hypothetical protein